MKIYYFLLFFLGYNLNSKGQKVIYSKMESFSKWRFPPKFEVIGKIQSNILVHQFDKRHYLKIFDNDMNQIKKVTLKFIPKNINGITFLKYSNYCTIIWQKVENQTIVFEYAKINNLGELQRSVASLDTINFVNQKGEIGFKTFDLILSEDKSKIAVSKFGIRKDTAIIISKIFNAELQLIEKNTVKLSDFDARINFLNDLLINNKGDIVFSVSDNILGLSVNNFQVFVKKMKTENLYDFSLPFDTIPLFNPSITIDYHNEEYVLSGFNMDTLKNTMIGIHLSKITFEQTTKKGAVKNFRFIKNIEFRKTEDAGNFYGVLDSKIFMRKDGSCSIVAGSINKLNNYYLKDYHYPFGQLRNGQYLYTNRGDDVLNGIDMSNGYLSLLNPIKVEYVLGNEPNLLQTSPSSFDQSFGGHVSVDNKVENTMSDIALLHINKDGSLKNDTTIQIPKEIAFKEQKTTFINSSVNFYTILLDEKNINIIAFTKNLNNQFLLNEFKIFNDGKVESNLIKAKYQYYYNLQAAKQVASNELIIPFFRINKMGFAKVY